MPKGKYRRSTEDEHAAALKKHKKNRVSLPAHSAVKKDIRRQLMVKRYSEPAVSDPADQCLSRRGFLLIGKLFDDPCDTGEPETPEKKTDKMQHNLLL